MAQQAQSEYQTVRIPLVGMQNTREFDSSGSAVTGPSSGTVGVGVVGVMIVGNQLLLNKDQRFVNCIPTALENEMTDKKSYYLIKRPGFEEETNVDPGQPGKYLMYWGIKNAGAVNVSAWRDTNSRIFDDTTSLGDITGEAIYMQEFTLGTDAAFLIQSSDNTLWYHVEGMLSAVTGNTNTNTTINGIGSTDGLYVGQAISGTDIPADTRIATIASGTSITITNAATGSSVGVNFTVGTLAKVIDTDYPGNMTPAKTVKPGTVFLDGYIFVMDSDGVVYNSDLNSIADWSANGSINSNSYPDKGVTLLRYRNLVVAANTSSLEFFSDNGNPSGTPLINNTQATVRIGVASPYGIVTVEDSMAWVSATDKGGCSVYMMEDYSPKKISTPIIDEQIALVGADSALLSAVKFFGRTFIFVVISSTTYVYCIEDKMWHEWQGAYNYWDFLVAAAEGVNHLYGISTNSAAGVAGKIWRLNVSSVIYVDNGDEYTMSVQTSKIDSDNHFRKRLSRLTLIGDRPILSAEVNVSWSDDDYQTWSTPRTIDMSDQNAYLNNVGRDFRRRAFKLTQTTNTGARWESLELNTIQGVN